MARPHRCLRIPVPLESCRALQGPPDGGVRRFTNHLLEVGQRSSLKLRSMTGYFAPDHAHAFAGKSFRRAVAGRIRTRRENRCSFGRRRNPVLRPLDPARIARPRRPHRLLRAAELPGSRRCHSPQSGVDRASVRRERCRRHGFSLHRLRCHSDGQAVAAGLAAAAIDRS